MAAPLPVKAKVISSSRCTLSHAAAFLNEYVCGNSTADPMVKGYLQNVVLEIEGIVSRRKSKKDSVSPRKQKVKGSGQGNSESNVLHFQTDGDVSCPKKKVLGLSELGTEELPPLPIAAGEPRLGSMVKSSLVRNVKRKLLDVQGSDRHRPFQKLETTQSKEDKLLEAIEMAQSRKKRSKEEKHKHI